MYQHIEVKRSSYASIFQKFKIKVLNIHQQNCSGYIQRYLLATNNDVVTNVPSTKSRCSWQNNCTREGKQSFVVSRLVYRFEKNPIMDYSGLPAKMPKIKCGVGSGLVRNRAQQLEQHFVQRIEQSANDKVILLYNKV